MDALSRRWLHPRGRQRSGFLAYDYRLRPLGMGAWPALPICPIEAPPVIARLGPKELAKDAAWPTGRFPPRLLPVEAGWLMGRFMPFMGARDGVKPTLRFCAAGWVMG